MRWATFTWGLALILALATAAHAQPGSIDLTFDPGAGIVASDPQYRRVEAIALQPDGKILIGGRFTNVAHQTRHNIARLTPEGGLDSSFICPVIRGNCPNCVTIRALAIQPDGKIVIGGLFTQIGSALPYNIARLNPDGSVDPDFNPAGPNSTVYAVGLQSDGKIVLGGPFTYFSGIPRNRVARLHPDGSLDLEFNPPGSNNAGPNNQVTHIAVLPDDKVMIAGWFTAISGISRERIARLNSNGTVDGTYVPAWPQSVGLDAFALAPDLRVVAASSTVYRLDTNGTVDATFRNGQRATGGVAAVVVQTNSKVILAGPFNAFEGIGATPRILRLNADGNHDTNFVAGLGSDLSITCMALQPDGRLLVGGDFNTFDGTNRSCIARLLGGEPPPEAPVILSQPTNQIADAGQTATFTVSVRASPPPAYQWLFNGSPISGATNSVYALVNARATNSGSYSVAISNESGQVVSDSAVLTVFTYPPAITAHPTNLTVDAGQTAVFSVTASGTMPFSYQWLSNAIPLAGRTQRQLSFRAMPEHAASYSVIVSNEAGSVTSDAAGLTVLVYPPTITSDPTNLTVVEGRVARFFVSVCAAPPPTYQWFLNGFPIPGRTNAVLSFSNPKPEDSGSYSVTVANTEGSASSASALLSVIPAPTTPGSVDVTFFTGSGPPDGAITRVALQRDSRILVGGTFTGFSNTIRNGFARLDSQGNLDLAFAPAGFGSGDVQFLAELSDGKILASKNLGGIARWNPDGSVDPTFTPPPFLSPTDVLTVQPDGSIVRNLSSQNGYTFQRLRPGGPVDFSFNGVTFTLGGGGTLPPPFTYRFGGHELPDGKIVVGGVSLFRIHQHGASDPNFRPLVSNGRTDGVLARPDGKVFVAGSFTNMNGVPRRGLALLNPDGSTDLTFNPTNSYSGSIWAMALQSDGKLLIGGSTALARLNPDGSIDPAFDPGSGANNTISSIVVQPDGRILVAGNFTDFDGYSRRRIVRLNGDPPGPPVITRDPASQSVTEGATVAMHVENTAVPPTTYQWTFNSTAIADETNETLRLPDVTTSAAGDYQVIVSNSLGSATSQIATLTVNLAPNAVGLADIQFGPGSGADSTVRAIARQANGKLIIAGWFNRIHDVPRASVARLNSDGSLDATFDPAGGPNDRIIAIAVDANDRILVGGCFTNFNGHARNRLARLLPDGNLDTSFDVGIGPQGGFNTSVRALALQTDGKIIVGGWFSSFSNVTRYGVVRLHPDGSLDASFAPTPAYQPEIDAVAVQLDGRIWAGGWNAVYRFRTNGVLDFPTGLPTSSLFNGRVRSILIQPDGKIVVAGTIFGSPANSILRLNPSGTLDTNFHAGYPYTGPFATSIETLRLHTCGKILVGGSFLINPSNPPRFYHVARLNSNGSLDQDFAPKTLDGIVFDIAVNDEKQIVIAGEFSKVDQPVRNGIARLHAEPFGPPVLFAQPVSQTVNGGSEVLLTAVVTNCSDFTFQWQLNRTNLPGGTNATLLLPSARTSQAGDYRVIVANGPHVTISDSAQIQVVPELRHPGSADIDFFPPSNLDGWVYALTLDSSRNVLVGGSFTRIAGIPGNRVARFNGYSETDHAFRADSNLVGTVHALATQPDGRILVGGTFPFSHTYTNFLLRLMPDGKLDTNFSRLSRGWGTAYAVAPLPDGRLLAAGVLSAEDFLASRSGIARFHPNGSLDTNFAAGGVRYPLALARQSDGRIIVGGTFTSIGQVPRASVARLLPNGPADPTFDPGDGPNAPVTAVAATRENKVYIGGNFNAVDGVMRRGIARLNDDGSVDADFDPGPGVGSVFALWLQPDGKLLVGGSFRYAGGLSRPGIARFNPDGAIDTTFNPGSGANAQVFAIAFDPAGKIYIGGNFTEYNGFARDRIARINGDMFLMNPAFMAGTFQVSVFTFFGESYVLEFQNSLAGQAWTSLPPILGDGTIKTLTDPSSTFSTRFYRVRSGP